MSNRTGAGTGPLGLGLAVVQFVYLLNFHVHVLGVHVYCIAGDFGKVFNLVNLQNF